jgi:hypothetical protein
MATPRGEIASRLPYHTHTYTPKVLWYTVPWSAHHVLSLSSILQIYDSIWCGQRKSPGRDRIPRTLIDQVRRLRGDLSSIWCTWPLTYEGWELPSKLLDEFDSCLCHVGSTFFTLFIFDLLFSFSSHSQKFLFTISCPLITTSFAIFALRISIDYRRLN